MGIWDIYDISNCDWTWWVSSTTATISTESPYSEGGFFHMFEQINRSPICWTSIILTHENINRVNSTSLLSRWDVMPSRFRPVLWESVLDRCCVSGIFRHRGAVIFHVACWSSFWNASIASGHQTQRKTSTFLVGKSSHGHVPKPGGMHLHHYLDGIPRIPMVFFRCIQPTYVK